MTRAVDLLLINPGNRLEQFAGLSPLATVAQPLGIALMAAYVRERGVSVAVIDAEALELTPEETVDKAIAEYDPMFVGLSAFTTKMTAAGAVLAEVKRRMPGALTLAGGHHPSAIPEQTLREEAADFVIKGEGFAPVTELVKRYRRKIRIAADIRGVWYLNRDGSAHDGGQAPGVNSLDELPVAAWDLLPMDRYRAHHWQLWNRWDQDVSKFALMYTSLGCPFSCNYCSVNVVYEKRKIRYRSPARVVDEFEHLIKEYGIQHFEIIDDTFTVNRHHVEALCDEIVRRGLGGKINAWCFSRVDRADPRFLSKMKAAGINWVFMGLESGNDTVLLGVSKGQTVAEIRAAVGVVHDAGIHVGGNFVFGLPEDTHESMQATLDLAKDLNTEYANFFIMMAYPGTELRDAAVCSGADLPKRWAQYGFFAPDAWPLANKTVTSPQILAFRDAAFKEYFGGERYQRMIAEKFGAETVAFLRERVLSKRIERRTV